MATVSMPQLGESVTEGTILKWLKQPGEAVKLDDALCEIETEKVTAELPSEFEGMMGRQLVGEGEVAPVGAPLCEIVEPGAAPAEAGSAAAPERAAGTATATATHASDPPATGMVAEAFEPATTAGGGWGGGPMAIPRDEPGPSFPPPGANGHAAAAAPAGSPAAVAAAAASPSRPDDRSRFYSPAVLRLARDRGIDLAQVHGSGIGGRVTRKDVESFAPAVAATAAAATAGPVEPAPMAAPARAAAAEPGEGRRYEAVALTPTRRKIAENLTRSNLEAPQAWTMVEADVTGLVRLREREKERFARQESVDLTLLPYFAAAVCESLREFPMLNARWEGEELRRYDNLDLGIAVATETGLVVPVVHDAGDLSVVGLAKRIADLAGRAQARKLRLEDIEGGTFTVNNTGSFGSIASKPIVNYPQVAIVTMERAVKRAVVREDDSIAVRWMMNVCLSFDHRAMDGLEAGSFLAALKRRLEAYM